MVMKRGEIWWASLAEPVGAEPGYRRPVVVLSSDKFNVSRISTVVCAAITSNLRLAEAPGNVALPARDSGLPRDSVVNVSQIITVTKVHLTERVGMLGRANLSAVESGVRLVLDL
jgi:mRNA interferase MazF